MFARRVVNGCPSWRDYQVILHHIPTYTSTALLLGQFLNIAVIFNNCTKILSDELESVQRHAAIAATRAYKNISNVNLLHECGLETLQSRNTHAKIVLFFKIKNNITPDYLKRLLPDEVGKNIDYNLSNSQDIQLRKISKNYFLKSYIPTTIRLWNGLTENIWSIAEADTFKTNLK